MGNCKQPPLREVASSEPDRPSGTEVVRGGSSEPTPCTRLPDPVFSSLWCRDSRSPLSNVRYDAFGQEGPSHSSTRKRSVDSTHAIGHYPIVARLVHTDSASPQGFSRRVTVGLLQESQIRWQVSRDMPAILCVANDHGGQHTIEPKIFEQGTFGQGSEPDDVECHICHCEDEESVILKCGTCSCIVYLGCMERWLAVPQPHFLHTLVSQVLTIDNPKSLVLE